MKSKIKKFATKAEVASILENLSSIDLLRLKRIAQLRSAGLFNLTWEDLFNEAVQRILSGARKYPTDISFVAFFAQSMRSIANEEWRRLQANPVASESDLTPSNPDNAGIDISDLAPTQIHPEREFVARKIFEEVIEIFNNDSEAIAVIRGEIEGASPKEIQSSANLTAIKYASAQRRIRRTLARYYLHNGIEIRGKNS